MRGFTYRMFVVAVAMTMALPPAVLAQASAPAETVAIPAPPHALRIAAGDLLELSVFDTPELSGKLRVDEDGEIVVPIAGAVRVFGMTAEEAGAAIDGKLLSADILKDPHVTVFITEYATQGVTVTGEVRNPGIYPLLGSHGLVDVLAAAGGITSMAGRVVSVTHKADPEHPEMVKLDHRPARIVANIDITPGDTVIVSKAGVAYVVGDVGKPGGFLIEGSDRLTVLQVMALAGSANHTAAPNASRLIRKTAHGREEMAIPLRAMMKGEVVDMPLEDGDILYIPSSKGKMIANRSVDVILGLTTGLLIGGKL